MAANETFDESPLADLDSEALDFRAASELFPQRAPLTKSDVQTLRLLAVQGRRLGPTVGGLLLVGKTPEARFPDAWIQCGRFRGTGKVELTDTVECRGRFRCWPLAVRALLCERNLCELPLALSGSPS